MQDLHSPRDTLMSVTTRPSPNIDDVLISHLDG